MQSDILKITVKKSRYNPKNVQETNIKVKKRERERETEDENQRKQTKPKL